MAQRIPPALEEEIRKLDNMQRQYQSFQVMAQTLQNELNEVKATLEELRKESDDTVTYKTVGQVMFKVEKPKMVEELDDREKTLEMRFASTSKQLQGFPEKLKELQEKIQLELGKHNLRLQ